MAFQAGWKDLENRDWKTDYRGLIAIHATKPANRLDLVLDLCEINKLSGSKLTPQDDGTFSRLKKWSYEVIPNLNHHGSAIVALAEMVDCVRFSPSPWFVGKFGFVFANVRQLNAPVVCPGQLGLWDVPEDLAEEVLHQDPGPQAPTPPIKDFVLQFKKPEGRKRDGKAAGPLFPL